MDYNESISFITEAYEKKGRRHSLDELKNILASFGGPEDKLKIIHVAGTNGKGSSCAMLASILIEAGYSAGVFTSPHLQSFNERIRINNQNISDSDFAAYAQKIKEKCESLSFFEILTLMAFVYFYERKVDFAIIEVGLGGRLCPTNVIGRPLVSVITKIGIDHTNFLGDSIESITAEKAGIIKKNSAAVLYLNDAEVYNIINDTVARENAKLYYGCGYRVVKRSSEETVFDIERGPYEYKNITLKMIGDYQAYNACNLLLAVKALNDAGLNINKDHVFRGLLKARWPGRMEIIKRDPTVLLDGAHNADGAYEFDRAVGDYFPGCRIILVAGVLKDKQYEKILGLVTKRASHVILTKPAARRALDPEDLYKAYDNPAVPAEIFGDFRQALHRAFELARPEDVVCVTGSLYLVADARSFILNGMK